MKNRRFINRQQNGTILISLLIALTMMATLGAGIYTLTASSSYSELLANNNNNAYDLARAGIRYGVGLQSPNLAATTFYLSDSNHTFTIAINNSVITSTGIVNAGTFFEARRMLVYDASWAPQPSSLLSFAKDMPSFGSPMLPNNQQAIQTDQGTNTVNLGGGVQDAYGALWYQGSSVAGFCSSGQCSFGTGINVYFDFTFAEDYSDDSTNSADGFTFTVMSAINNTRDRTGGAVPGYSAGELMGYAGPGATADKLGLKPPKLALEFDPYPNGNGEICSSSSRNDADAGTTSFKNHVALMLWGDRAPSGGGSCTFGGVPYPRASFDDNRHGAGGSGDDPQNSLRPASADPSSGYYEYAGGRGYQCKNSSNTCNWLEDGYPYSARFEITRPTAPSGSVYNYQVKAWIIRRDLAGFTDIQTSHFQDVMVPYGDSPPQIDRTFSLAAQDHDDFRIVFLGFTEGTGASTQQVTLANLKMFFPQGTCSYAIFSGDISSPTSANYTVAGGSGNISITTTTVCPWTASSLVPWITLAPGTDNGKGNGSVNYTVAANPFPAPFRIGQLNVAGQTFTVTQDGTCAYLISPSSAAPAAAGASGSTVNVTAGTGCTWTATSNNAWITVTGGSSGAGNGAVTYNVAANTGSARTGTMTIAGQTFTVNQAASSCTYLISPSSATPVAAGATSSTVIVTAGTGCAWTAVSNEAWIAITGGSSGNGNGTVTYNVSTNAGSSSRTGTMTIAGLTFTVTQNGACTAYRVWNNTGNTWDFKVTGNTCRSNRTDGSEITSGSSSTQLQSGETVSRYTTSGGGCSSAVQGSITYTTAVGADIDGDCRVYYDAGDTASDR